MKKLIEFFIGRSLLVNLLTVLILAVGGVSLFFLQKEIFPKIEFDVILVTSTYPGSSAEDVEKLVTISLERSLKSVDGIKTMNALSAEGNAIIYIEVNADAAIRSKMPPTPWGLGPSAGLAGGWHGLDEEGCIYSYIYIYIYIYMWMCL